MLHLVVEWVLLPEVVNEHQRLSRKAQDGSALGSEDDTLHQEVDETAHL